MIHGLSARIYPKPAQVKQLEINANAARFAYNWGVAKYKSLYESRQKAKDLCDEAAMEAIPKPSAFTIGTMLTAEKKSNPELEWLKEADSKCVGYAVANVELAFKNFFRRLKSGEKPGYPRFKSWRSAPFVFSTRGSVFIEAGRIRAPKMGWIAVKPANYLPEGKARSFTFSRVADRWFVSALCEVPEKEPVQTTGKTVFCEMDLDEVRLICDGEMIEKFIHPRPLERQLTRLRRLSREFSKCEKDGKNWQKTKLKLQTLHWRVANQRNEWLQETTSKIIRDIAPDMLVLPGVEAKELLEERVISRHISDFAYFEFERQLRYKGVWYGVEVKIDDQNQITLDHLRAGLPKLPA